MQAHYQYLLFLRNSFDKAAGAGTAGRRLADAMCQESRTLHRVLDIEVCHMSTPLPLMQFWGSWLRERSCEYAGTVRQQLRLSNTAQRPARRR